MAEATGKPLRAVVFGSTGAIGREVVSQLCANPRWTSVTTIGRRALEPPPAESAPGKLKQLVVNMDALETDPKVESALSEGVNSIFCALGTTRGVAGSADAFRKVDLDYVAAAARAAKKANVPHFSLVSAQGANANMWASDLKPFHGLLYAQTKGKAEEAVTTCGFAYSSIMRPGLLERGDLARTAEKIYAKLVSSVPASKVAAVMIKDAEQFVDGGGSGDVAVKIWNMKEIQKYDAGK